MPSRVSVLIPAILIGLLPAQEARDRIAAKVDQYLAPLVEMELFSGAVLIARGGEILVHKAWGLADRKQKVANTTDTRFKLMSTSKTFTGTAVMRLVQDGKLKLDDPVGKHLPDWPEVWSKVTVHDLLDHTSGIPNLETQWGTVSRSGAARGLAVWRAFAPKAARPLMSTPGTVFSYSNFNTVLAGCVAEVASGVNYREYVTAKILEPAGMTATGFDDGARHEGLAIGYVRGLDCAPDPSQQDMSHIQPAGGYWSTASDLYRFDRALRGDSLLDAATRTRMVTPRNGPYACCWVNEAVHGHPCIQHNGGANGYVADFLRFHDDDACVVVLINHAFAPILRISHDLAAILFGADYAQPQALEVPALDACTGVYQWPNSAARMVVRRCGRTLLQFDVRPGMAGFGSRVLLPVGKATFAEAIDEARLLFENDGTPPRLRRNHRTGENVLERVAVPLADWQAAAGELTAEPAIGKRVSLASDAGRLWLRVEGGWPERFEVVPVDAVQAMVLYSPEGGTMMRRDGKRFRWQRADGTEVRLERK